MLTNFASVSAICSYMSSVAIRMFGCLRSTSPSACRSSSVYTAPDGLLGLLITTILVLGVIAASSCAGRHLEALLDARLHDHRLAFRDQHDVRIRDPVRRGNDHLVAGIDHRQREIEETLLAAARDQDLLRGVIQPVVALELGDHRRFQRRRAADRGVLGETLVDRARSPRP